MSALLLPSRLRQQPQQGAQLDRSNRLAANAQAILSAAQDLNHATGKQLTRGGSGFAKQHLSAGQAWSFRKNFYVETEVLPAIGTGAFVEFWMGYPSTDVYAKGSANEPGFVTGSSANQFGICATGGVGHTGVRWGCVNNWGSNTFYDSGESLTPGVLTVLLVYRYGTTLELWRNGQMIQRFTGITPTSLPAQTLICGSFVEDTGYWPSSSDTVMAGRILVPTAVTAAEIRAFSENPWALWQAPRDRAVLAAVAGYAPVAANTSLSGAAVAVAAASGALSTSIRLAGGGVGAASAAGILKTAIALAGTGAAMASATGVLSTSIQLSGSASARASAFGTLASGGAGLSGGAVASAGASGVLSTAITLAGTAQALASATGTLATPSVGLSGAARAEAVATGTLSTGIRLVGSAGAQASVAGALSTQIRLAGTAAVVASVYGALTTKITLGGAAVASATATGALSTAPLKFDISKIPRSRIAVFGGSGSRVAVFDGSGSRVSRFT